jgi:thiamine pyrophosphokinase
MTTVILCNGERPSMELLFHHLQQASLIICTDGAVEWAGRAGCHPQVVIGDMDSCGPLPECEVVDAGPHEQQENTDAEKAVLLALARGARRIVLLGATGKRLDHTLGNVWLVARYHQQAEIILADDLGELRVLSSRRILATRPGALLSLLALTPDVALDTEGLKWPLHGPLEAGTRGLSNEAMGDRVTIDVRSGLVAVIETRDRP